MRRAVRHSGHPITVDGHSDRAACAAGPAMADRTAMAATVADCGHGFLHGGDRLLSVARHRCGRSWRGFNQSPRRLAGTGQSAAA